MDCAVENAAAELIGAEPVNRIRRLQPVNRIEPYRIARKPWREQRRSGQKEQDCRADEYGHMTTQVVAKPAPAASQGDVGQLRNGHNQYRMRGSRRQYTTSISTLITTYTPENSMIIA